MNNPLVSICIPTYNGSAYLAQCIESAIQQTYANIEILIVDDKSTDNTCQLIEKYAASDSRIKLIRNQKNLGLVGNWNRCMDLAKGEWVKFLFQDDYFDSDCISVMVESISDGDKIITSGRRLVFEESIDEASKNYSLNETLTFSKLGIHTEKPIALTPEQITKFTVDHICMNFIGEPTTVMFRKEMAGELGYFNPDLVQICDLEYFLRIATRYGMKYIPQALTYFRAGAHSGSASSANISKRQFSMLHIDPIITTHLLLYNAHFASFRKALSGRQKMKLNLFFRVRTYEAYKSAMNSNKENSGKFEAACNKYPEINKHKHGNVFIKLVLLFIKQKRVFA
jgi:glycosyltransferase involved in cell wall biosynthesis